MSKERKATEVEKKIVFDRASEVAHRFIHKLMDTSVAEHPGVDSAAISYSAVSGFFDGALDLLWEMHPNPTSQKAASDVVEALVQLMSASAEKHGFGFRSMRVKKDELAALKTGTADGAGPVRQDPAGGQKQG
jgi:hypothetical protein